MIDQRDDHRHRRGHQRHPQILHHRDDAIVTAEFAGDRNQARRATGDQRQGPGERADVAVQPEQGACGDAEHSVATATPRTIGQSGPSAFTASRSTIVRDVDAEHALGGDADRARNPLGSQCGQRQRDADDQRGEQRGRGNADHGQRDGDRDRDSDQQRPPGRLLQSLSRHYDKYALNKIRMQHGVLAMTAKNYQGITW